MKFLAPAFIGAVLGVICVLLVALLTQLALEIRITVILLALAAILVIRVTRRNWKPS